MCKGCHSGEQEYCTLLQPAGWTLAQTVPLMLSLERRIKLGLRSLLLELPACLLQLLAQLCYCSFACIVLGLLAGQLTIRVVQVALCGNETAG